MQRKQLILNGLATVLLTCSAYPFGIRVDDKDALATARGNAFTATADNPSALYYNPAGITQLDSPALLVGSYNLIFEVDYTNLNDEDFSNEGELQLVPQAYFTLPIENTPFTVGFTSHVPFGLENDWPEDTSFSTIATESSFRYLRFSPVVAWEVNPAFSIAAGLAFDDGEADLRRTHPVVNEVRLEGTDQTLGYVLGAHWRLSEKHVFGATYRSRTTFDLTGTMTFGPNQTGAEAEFPFPDVAVVGYSFRPNPKWNLEINIDWTNWDVLDAVTVKTDDGNETDMPFHWTSSFVYKFGATRYFAKNYHVSAGYMFSENSVPDDYFSPSVPDADRHLVSAGIGRSHENLAWDLAYQFGYSPTRRVRGSQSPGTTETADGDYRAVVHALTASVSYTF